MIPSRPAILIVASALCVLVPACEQQSLETVDPQAYHREIAIQHAESRQRENPDPPRYFSGKPIK